MLNRIICEKCLHIRTANGHVCCDLGGAWRKAARRDSSNVDIKCFMWRADFSACRACSMEKECETWSVPDPGEMAAASWERHLRSRPPEKCPYKLEHVVS
jgi:hypothetical protein